MCHSVRENSTCFSITDAGEFTLPTALCVCHGLQLCCGDFLCLRSAVSPGIFHCRVAEVDRNQDRELIRVSLVDFPEGFSVDQLNNGASLFSLEVIAQGQAFRRMISKNSHFK